MIKSNQWKLSEQLGIVEDLKGIKVCEVSMIDDALAIIEEHNNHEQLVNSLKDIYSVVGLILKPNNMEKSIVSICEKALNNLKRS